MIKFPQIKNPFHSPDQYLTFDDVNIVPQWSMVASRKDVSLHTKFTRNLSINIPIVASPMDTVCGIDMAVAIAEKGGIGCIPRFCSIDEQCEIIRNLKIILRERNNGFVTQHICAAVGLDGYDRTKKLLHAGANAILIDVANGGNSSVVKFVQELGELKYQEDFDIIVGNFADAGSISEILTNCGDSIDAFRVGIGNGSVCETRIRTGIGVPQISALLEIKHILDSNGIDIPIISDGGVRYPGDCSKAICAGASTVMIGSMFAGTLQSPGDIVEEGMYGNIIKTKIFRGMASFNAKSDSGANLNHIEGASGRIHYKGDVNPIIDDLTDGLRSACSYVGAYNLEEFYKKSKFVKVTQSGILEAKPHLLVK